MLFFFLDILNCYQLPVTPSIIIYWNMNRMIRFEIVSVAFTRNDLCRLTAITTTMRRCYKLLLFLLLYYRRRLRYAPPSYYIIALLVFITQRYFYSRRWRFFFTTMIYGFRICFAHIRFVLLGSTRIYVLVCLKNNNNVHFIIFKRPQVSCHVAYCCILSNRSRHPHDTIT